MCSKQLNGAARGQIGNGDLEKRRVIWAQYVSVCSQHEVSVESGIHEFAFGSMCVEKRGVLGFWEHQHLRSEKGASQRARKGDGKWRRVPQKPRRTEVSGRHMRSCGEH